MTHILWTGALLLLSTAALSQDQQTLDLYYGKVLPGETVRSQNSQSRAAACAPSTAIRDLEWNNVRALIETGGSMWQDRAQFRSAYEVPKGGGVSAIFALSLIHI